MFHDPIKIKVRAGKPKDIQKNMNAGVMPTLFSPEWLIVLDPNRHLLCCLVKCKTPCSPSILAKS